MATAGDKAWRCGVCGYVHRGERPPEYCPVCGAGTAQFEAEPAKPSYVSRSEPPGRWRCLNCSHVADSARPPASCPVCAAPADRFEPVVEEPGPARAGKGLTKLVVVGGGIAGVAAAEAARQCAPEAEIVLISREPSLPYYRLNLTRYLAGEIGANELPIHGADWYAERGVQLLLGVETKAVDLDGHAVCLSSGESISFERLVLSAGAHAFIPAVPGAQLPGVLTLRGREDAERLLAAAEAGATCVCVGGGLLGLETAGALARRGVDVSLLEGHAWLMPRQLNRRAGERLREHVLAAGIRLHTDAATQEILGLDRARGVRLQNGTVLPADLVLMATGVRPNSHLARSAGLEVNKGVVVDNRLATSHPDVFAAGDVAEHYGTLYGAWAASQYQGRIAGLNAAGGQAEFGGLPRSNTLKVLGLDLLSIGQFEPEDGSFMVAEQETALQYLRFVFHDGRLVGAVLLGDATLGPVVKKHIEAGTSFAGLLAHGPSVEAVVARLRGEGP